MRSRTRGVYRGLGMERKKVKGEKGVYHWGKKAHYHIWKLLKGPLPGLSPEICIKCGEVSKWS